jgi:hypothetical protein
MIEARIHIPVAPSVVFKIWSEVDRWKDWDPDTKEARLDGAFAVGTRGFLVPTKGRGVPIRITECIPDKLFICEGGCEVIHRVRFSGFLRFIFGPLIGAQIRKGLPITMASLKRYALARTAV